VGGGVEVFIDSSLPVITRQRHSRGLAGALGLMLDLLSSLLTLWTLARKFKPDIIHTNTAVIFSPGLVARLVGAGHVWHVREVFVEFPRYWRWYQWYMSGLSDKIVCMSAAVADQFHEGIRRQKVLVIYDGFPTSEFEPVDEGRVKAFRDKFALEGFTLVGVVGRIKFGRKGQEFFVKAASLLKNKYPRARFLLIGSPFPGNEEHLHRLNDLIKSLGIEDAMVYTGDVEDIKAAYAALDISVVPSAFPEPFGGVVTESMAMGKPVVGSRAGGIVEQVEDGVTGYLVPPGDSEELAAALDRLLADAELRRRMGENGRKRFLAMFRFEPFYEKVLALYASVQKGRRPG
jgi:glycosyltransferase involved in cell wall biosynthesis